MFAVQFGVTIFNEPIAPEPLVNAADVVPVTTPPVCVIVPAPLAETVVVVPEDTFADKTMLPPFVNVCNVTAPVAPVIAPEAVNALALLELLVILIVLPPLTTPVFTVPVA